MRVAIFTDNDFDKINGVTTTLTALLAHAPGDVRPRIYTAASLGTDQPDYLALRSRGVPIPFYGEMQMYVPHWREYLRRVQRRRGRGAASDDSGTARAHRAVDRVRARGCR